MLARVYVLQMKTHANELKARDEELKTLKQGRYVVDPTYVTDRVDCCEREPRIDKVLAKWEPRTTGEGWTAYDSYHNYRDKHLVNVCRYLTCMVDMLVSVQYGQSSPNANPALGDMTFSEYLGQVLANSAT